MLVTSVPRFAAQAQPQTGVVIALAVATAPSVLPACGTYEPVRVGAFDVPANWAGDLQMAGGFQRCVMLLHVKVLLFHGGDVLLDVVSVAKEAVPIGDTLDGQLDLGQPQVAAVMTLHGRPLHITPQAEQETRDVRRFVISDVGNASDGWHVVVVPQRLEPPATVSGWPEILTQDRASRRPHNHPDRDSEGIDGLRKSGPIGSLRSLGAA